MSKISVSEFTVNKDYFIKNVYEYFCQCQDQCLKNYSSYFNTKKDNTIVCSQIISTNIDYKSYDKLIKTVIKYFEKDLGLLLKRGSLYYILDTNKKLKLTWDNIKTMEITEKISNQELFWFFRKLIVDSIIKKILNKEQFKDLKVYSVGSAKVDSDYDITLYGDTTSKIQMIKEFENYFKSILLDDSSVVFDTNIYGKGFITYDEDEYGSMNVENIYANVKNDKDKQCGQNFYYLKAGDPNSQLMWGLIKYLKDLREGFGENLYNQVKNYTETHVGNSIAYAHSTFIYLKNQPQNINYNVILSSEKKFIKDYKINDKLTQIHDYLGLLNFYGNETYFTRGAFLDVVINYQTCKQAEPIKLLEIDYITSILENAGFFFVHNNKTKYILRVYRSLQNLKKFDYDVLLNTKSYKSFVKIIDTLKTLKETQKVDFDYDEKYCNNLIIEDDFNLLKCEKYELFGLLITIVCKLLKIYKSKNDIEYKPIFYNYFIKKESSVLKGNISYEKNYFNPSQSIFDLTKI